MKKFFSIVTLFSVVLLTSSCKKDGLYGQTAQDATTIAYPVITGIGQGTSTVFYNGRSVTLFDMPLFTSTAVTYTFTGIMLEPLTRPAEWQTNTQGTSYIATGNIFNTNMSAGTATVWFVQNKQMASMTMEFGRTPNTSNDFTAYQPGTYNLKSGWIGGPYTIKAWYGNGGWQFTIMN